MSIFSTTNKTKNPNYAPGVDGLRTIAVVIVLLFHLGFSSVSGGYVGVDVFFVISGFLITGIIFNNIDKNKFSYLGFMSSRISRLYPALIFILIFIILFGFLLYSPADLVQVSESAVYATFSLSNIFFANNSGYFDNSSEINPLLHTWSLAVEQQFYLVWPIIILLSYKINKKAVPYIIGFIAIASLVASQWATKNMQIEGYYWTPFRMFELALGGVIFFISKKCNPSTMMKEFMMLVGIVLILYSAITFTPSTQFPGLNAMIPVTGAMLCILSHDAKYTGFIVNNRFSVGVGLISYSVYLIHWPLIVFYKYWVFRELNIQEKILILFSSFFIAYFMYVYIENKYRKINLRELSAKSIALTASIFICAFLFSFTISQNGFIWRSSNEIAMKYSDNKLFHNDFFGGTGYKQGINFLGDKSSQPRLVLLGDSFARQYASSIQKLEQKNGSSIIAFFADGCFLSNEYTRMWSGKPGGECFKTYREAVKYANEHHLPIIYAQRWIGYKGIIGKENGEWLGFKDDEDYSNFLVRNIKSISKSINNSVYIILGTNGAGTSGVLSCISRPSFTSDYCMNNMQTKFGYSRVDILNSMIVKKLANHPNIMTIDVNKAICQNEKCKPIDDNGNIIYSDSVHLSDFGSKIAWDYINKSID
ncbi:acyltransferase [Proteus mirabilis]|uniref:acyltransferase family protein n=1 Tax=Proteus mirabilis TaxID=584 RepID=UPI0019D22F71|nr:acyltransferase family protein [Proteus mirabilis]MBI6365794.1 acyltransferase [Proteus mirabilis]MBN7225331.1 acyltransferase [Proteus mirabilis]MBN7245731.1 acyltransferase [Proteus mirabilis]MBN7260233.1 acyltransferase [Proteus mirabilis]MBN7270588.1 acyltransferase [Proteus mirabilis]